MKKFLLNFILFCIPFAILFAVPFGVFIFSREYLPLSVIVDRQQHSAGQEITPQNPTGDTLYLSGTASTDRQYKLLTTIERNPEVVAFGTSRTLDFKSSFFKDPKSFYNAGDNAGDAFRADDLLSFINAVPQDGKLRVILFDTSSFLTEAAVGKSQSVNLYDAFHVYLTSTWRNIYIDYAKHKFSFSNLWKTQSSNSNMGISARLYGYGYREDGSLNRGIVMSRADLQEKVKKEIISEVSTLNPQSGGFADYSATLPPENLAIINQFLDICKARNIYVIGYLSPYAIEIHNKMNSLEGPYGEAYRQMPVVLGEALKSHGYDFYDIRDMNLIGATDDELYDPHHLAEKGSIKLLQYIASKEPALASYIDAKNLERQIDIEKY